MKSLTYLILLPYVFLIISGCAPSISCKDANVDGSELLKILSDPKTSLDTAAQSIVDLNYSCELNEKQLDVVDTAVKRIATDGSMELQWNFYGRLYDRESTKSERIRLSFIRSAPSINDKNISLSEQEKMLEVGKINPVNFVNFNKSDAANDELISKIISQGFMNKAIFKKAIEHIKFDDASSTPMDSSDRFHYVSKLFEAETVGIKNIKLLLNNSSSNLKSITLLSSLESEIGRRQAQLKNIHPPEKLDKPDYDYEKVSIALAREVYPSENIVKFPEKPYVYLGSVIGTYPSKMVILSSEKNLYGGPVIITVLAMRGSEPAQYMFNGFTQDFWHYSALTADEEIRYNEYLNRKNEELKQLVTINAIKFEADKIRKALSGIAEFSASTQDSSILLAVGSKGEHMIYTLLKDMNCGVTENSPCQQFLADLLPKGWESCDTSMASGGYIIWGEKYQTATGESVSLLLRRGRGLYLNFIPTQSEDCSSLGLVLSSGAYGTGEDTDWHEGEEETIGLMVKGGTLYYVFSNGISWNSDKKQYEYERTVFKVSANGLKKFYSQNSTNKALINLDAALPLKNDLVPY